MVYGAFSTSVLGMMSQSQALNTISTNIANVDTGGYKASDTRFSSLVSDPLYQESDLSGPRPWNFQRIDQQGLLQASDNSTDLGINGNGFFVLSDSFDGTGHTFYGRDGSFQMQTVNDVPVTAADGSTITVKDGYLTDKNGYFVLGWQPNADGTFPTSGGTLAPMRVDSYAFADQFQPTTTAVLGLNLPATAPTGDTETYSANLVDSAGNLQTVTYSFLKSQVANQWILTPKTNGAGSTQVDTATLAGTPEVGDQYIININGSSFSYTTQGTQQDTVTLSGAPQAGDTYSVSVNGTPVSYTASQTDTATLSGTVEGGDIYSVTINGNTFNHTAVGTDTLTDIRDDLLAQISGSGLPVTATANGADGITVQSQTAPFTLIASATNGGGNPDNAVATTSTVDSLADIRDNLISQANTTFAGTVTAAASTTDPNGFTVTADAEATPFTFATSATNPGDIASTTTSIPDTLSDIRDALISQINGSDQSAVVTAAADGTDGITVTANAADTPFSLSASAVNGGATADNAVTTTTTATVLSFDSNGRLVTPADATLNIAFDGGSTASVDVDLSSMTQYAGDFTPVTYSRSGYAACDMQSFSFDANGDVVGTFDDGSTRTLYKIPLAVFSNPDGLEAENGNVFAPTTDSGDPNVVAATARGAGSFEPNSRELSNVDIQQEFTSMILTQNAYNSSAEMFKTIDEMMQTTRDLIS